MTTNSAMATTFKFIEFNTVRASRGANAARVEATDEQGERWLWMSRADIKNNIKDFGDSTALQKALTAYGAWN